ncbi:MAG: hypothetical protein HY912_10665 [Desulfomonile tiedjei]|uniref:Uncharacterized protein n=1 Tax=Desulfomonile tiedjei TaxID=2358 RepID=A0A9D6Z3I8_9BACT|nr:hypothetical protein [Desulfomonile tiedjei]
MIQYSAAHRTLAEIGYFHGRKVARAGVKEQFRTDGVSRVPGVFLVLENGHKSFAHIS